MINQNRKLILIAVVVILVALGLTYLFAFRSPTPEEETAVSEVETEEKMELMFTSGPHVAPLGSINPDSDKEFVFEPGEQFGIAGKYKSGEEKEITVNLLNSNKDLIEKEFLSEFTAQATEASTNKSFSVCCGDVPEETGQYYLELTTNSSRLKLVPFEVDE